MAPARDDTAQCCEEVASGLIRFFVIHCRLGMALALLGVVCRLGSKLGDGDEQAEANRLCLFAFSGGGYGTDQEDRY